MSDKNTAQAEKQSKVVVAFQAAMKKQINGDQNHGWGQKDQVAVIVACVTAEMGKEPSKDLVDAIERQVNGSAFRQKLEKAGVLNKAAETQKAAVDRFLAEFKV